MKTITLLRQNADFGLVQMMRVFDYANWLWPDVTDPAYLDYLYKLPTTRSFWKIQGNYGTFDYPPDYRSWLDIYLWDNVAQSGQYKFISVSIADSTPTLCYLLPFVNMTPHADSQGNHYGTHPTGAWIEDKSLLDVFVNASQGNGTLHGLPPVGSVKIIGFTKNQRYLNIRTEPNEKSKIVSWLYKGDTVLLLPDNPVEDRQYTWRKVKKLNFIGWAAWNLVVTT